MSKLFLALLISLFVLAASVLGFVFSKWNTQRLVLSWELMRQRGYDYLHRSKTDYAMEYFSKGRELALGLGASDYRYAGSLVDIADVLISSNDLDEARKLLRQANSIFEKSNSSDQLINTALRNEQFRCYCLLANLELKAGKFERSQKLCKKIVEVSTQPQLILEALTRRQIASTLMAAGDFASTRRDAEMATGFYKEALNLTANLAPFRDLERAAQKKMQGDGYAASASDLLEKGAQYMKRRQLPIARQYLVKARELAVDTNDPAIMQIDFNLAKLEISQNNFEQAENSLLELLRNPNFKDNTGIDEVLTKLTLIYRNCGYMEDAVRILRKEVALRQKEYGSDSAKVTAIELELAQTLESIGRYDEAKKIWQSTLMLKQALGDEEDSSRLAGVILRTGDFEKAKPMLERIVYGFQNGSIKPGHSPVQACYQLAAIYLIEGKAAEANNLIEAAAPHLSDLAPIHKLLVSEILLDTALALPKHPVAASEMLRQSILALPVPDDRRSALRCLKALKRVNPLRGSNPKVFDTKVNAKLEQITQASSSYAPAKLQGYAG